MSRPPKYPTEEERREARRASDRKKYQRIRAERLAQGWIPKVKLSDEERAVHRKASLLRWYLKKRSTGWKPKQTSHRIKNRSWLKQRYGLTVAEWDRMLVGQAGRCACCGDPLNHRRGPLVDHDHATGDIRGLVCHDCNIAIGWFEGRGDRLRQAEMYLAAFLRRRVG